MRLWLELGERWKTILICFQDFNVNTNASKLILLSVYRAFHEFGQAKFSNGSSVLGLSQFSILPQLPPKILLNSKVVKINQKIIILLCKSKSKIGPQKAPRFSFCHIFNLI